MFFQKDTDSFQDRKIRRLIRKFGGDGYLAYDFILCTIYRDKGYYVLYDADFCFDVADQIYMEEEKVREIIDYCCEVGLFSQRLFVDEKIITGKGIQSRWLEMNTVSKRKDKIIHLKYLADEVNSEETAVNSEETTINTEETKKNSGKTTHSIIEYNKEENIYNHWNSKGIIVHKEMTKEIRLVISKALKKYSHDSIFKAIDRYSEVFNSKFFFDYKWSLSDLLSRKNGLPDFMDEGSKWLSYCDWKDQKPKNGHALKQLTGAQK